MEHERIYNEYKKLKNDIKTGWRDVIIHMSHNHDIVSNAQLKQALDELQIMYVSILQVNIVGLILEIQNYRDFYNL